MFDTKIAADKDYVYVGGISYSTPSGGSLFRLRLETGESSAVGSGINFSQVANGQDGFLYASSLGEYPSGNLYKINSETFNIVDINNLKNPQYNPFEVDSQGHFLVVTKFFYNAGNPTPVVIESDGSMYVFPLPDYLTADGDVSNDYIDLELCPNGILRLGAKANGHSYTFSLTTGQVIETLEFGAGDTYVACVPPSN